MRLSVEENPQVQDVEVSIVCPSIDGRVRAVMAAVGALDRKLLGEAEGSLHVVAAAEVLYVESVDGRTFLYTEGMVLESRLRLCEVEDALSGTEFVRVSKAALVNFDHIRALRPYANARLELILGNGEHLLASRQYAPAIKRKLGL